MFYRKISKLAADYDVVEVLLMTSFSC